MATIKTIKNNYYLLTKQERFGLYQKAMLREDENELEAIFAATSMKSFNVIDFYFLREEIFRLDTGNLLARLGHTAMFKAFFRGVGGRLTKEPEHYMKMASSSAYLYVIETDAWAKVCDDLGFEVDWFRTLTKIICFAVDEMESLDFLMRDLAFTEDQVREFINESKGKNLTEKSEIKTIDQLVKSYRSLIEEI